MPSPILRLADRIFSHYHDQAPTSDSGAGCEGSSAKLALLPPAGFGEVTVPESHNLGGDQITFPSTDLTASQCLSRKSTKQCLVLV